MFTNIFYRFYSYHSVYFLLQLRCAQVNQDLCITVSTNKLHNEDLDEGGREKQKSIIPPHQNLCDSIISMTGVFITNCAILQKEKTGI